MSKDKSEKSGKNEKQERSEKPKQEKRHEAPKPQVRSDKPNTGARKIVRIVDTDLNGELQIENSLLKIKGINRRLARIVVKTFEKETGVSRKLLLGHIPSDKDEALSAIIRDPIKHKIPGYFLNRPHDIYVGHDKHVINSDLAFEKREDLQRLSKIKARRGLRLLAGLPVRGQRTKSNYRRKGSKVIGVEKKK